MPSTSNKPIKIVDAAAVVTAETSESKDEGNEQGMTDGGRTTLSRWIGSDAHHEPDGVDRQQPTKVKETEGDGNKDRDRDRRRGERQAPQNQRGFPRRVAALEKKRESDARGGGGIPRRKSESRRGKGTERLEGPWLNAQKQKAKAQRDDAYVKMYLGNGLQERNGGNTGQSPFAYVFLFIYFPSFCLSSLTSLLALTFSFSLFNNPRHSFSSYPSRALVRTATATTTTTTSAAGNLALFHLRKEEKETRRIMRKRRK